MDKATPSEQFIECVELVISDDQMAETGVTVDESEMVAQSSDLIEIAAVLRHSLSRNLMLVMEILVQSHCQMEKNRMLRDMDMTNFK